MSQFTGKHILIAGASSGIGKALLQHLTAEGATVTTLGRNTPDAGEKQHITLDVSDWDGGKIADFPDQLDGLVYCPGSIKLKPFNRYKPADFMQEFQLNAMGAALLLQQAQNALKKGTDSAVVLFSTVAVQTGMPYHSSIAMAKGAVEGLTRALAAEWSAAGIRVNAIAPSLTDTPLAAALLATDDKRKASADRHPLKRIGSAEEVAQTAAFLLSSSAGFVTGQVLQMDGGLSSVKPL